MNYLELCDSLMRESGVEESGILSVASQTGLKKKVVRWVDRAWTEIQGKRDWDFLWNETSFTTNIGQQDYHPAENLVLDPPMKSLDRSSVIITGEAGTTKQYLKYIRWQDFDNTVAMDGSPTTFTIKPDGTIRLGTKPTAAQLVEFQYYRTPQALVNNTDVPIVEAHHHDTIIYQAMIYLAAEQDAPELYQDAVTQLEFKLRLMASSSLSGLSIAVVPLA